MNMRRSVSVEVPYLKQLPYTLYAKGSLIEIPFFDENENFAHFRFTPNTVFVLFYTFKTFRRAYIVSCWQNEKDGEPIILPGVNEKLCLIFTARGKKVDHLKRVLYILTEEQGNEHQVFTLPLLFWYRLGALIQQSGAARSDLAVLWESFTQKKLIKLSKKEIKKRKSV